MNACNVMPSTPKSGRPAYPQAAHALPPTFYQRNAAAVARELLGARLCHRLADGRIWSGVIVETEAYHGASDPASHAYQGRHTARTETMFAAGGIAYVYLIYGMYHCLNAVAGQRDDAEAVLIRALRPDQDEVEWQQRFPRLKPWQRLSGPGRLCRAMGIDKSFDGLSLQSSRLWIAPSEVIAEADVRCGPRIGVDYAGDAAQWPLRFFINGEKAVSRPRQAE
jgi:DNA-3-methyladenine glycosylase